MDGRLETLGGRCALDVSLHLPPTHAPSSFTESCQQTNRHYHQSVLLQVRSTTTPIHSNPTKIRASVTSSEFGVTGKLNREAYTGWD